MKTFKEKEGISLEGYNASLDFNSRGWDDQTVTGDVGFQTYEEIYDFIKKNNIKGNKELSPEFKKTIKYEFNNSVEEYMKWLKTKSEYNTDNITMALPYDEENNLVEGIYDEYGPCC